MSFKKVYSESDIPDIPIQEKLLKNKIYPQKYKQQIILALSHFPELIDLRIRFEEKKQWFPLASRPNWKTISRNKENWEYLILISTSSKAFPKELLFENLPFNAQIGILGHELCHTIFFLEKKMAEIISLGVKYLNTDYRVKFEKETDREVIRRGLGWQLKDFAEHCRGYSSDKIQNWLDKYYLLPSEIEYILNHS